ncbi:MAG: DUF2244 domain-containing protein [Stenotrophomonas sp.]
MIEMLRLKPEGSGVQLLLHPPRALSDRQFVQLFAALAGLMLVSAAGGWLLGNFFALGFALLYCLLVAAALRWLWRSGQRREEIRVGPDCVEVIPAAGGSSTFQAHPHWVRLFVEDERVLLISSGRWVEVGSFLAPAERRELVVTLEGLLAASDGGNR